MSEGKNNFKIFGVVYIVLGLWFNFFFLASFSQLGVASGMMAFLPHGLSLAVFTVAWIGSWILVVFGSVLVGSDVVWVWWVSGVLFVFLLGCIFLILYYPLIVVFVQA